MSSESSSDREIIGDLQSMIRREEARLIATEVLRRRAGGEVIADEAILAEHVAFMPELAEELRIVREIHHLALAARKAGTSADTLRVLSLEELEAPLGELPGEVDDVEPAAEQTLRIEGFTLLNEIGRGGQAVVYKAVQETTGRRVAVKVLSGGGDAESEHRARFEREVRTLAALDHPHIVRIVDRGRTAGGAFYLAMDLVDGWTFDEFAAECVSIDEQHPRMLLEAMIKVVRAVDAAHRQGVIHRDLKPSNIRVSLRGEPRILDFGLAKTTSADQPLVTSTGQWIGSLPWFSPEVARHGQSAAGPHSDIYALGVVCYQALAGRFPYPVTGTLPEVLKRICEQSPAPLQVAGLPSKLRAGLDAVLARAMAKPAAGRYETAGAFADDLEAVLQGRRPLAVATTRRRWWRRLIGLVAVLILLANVGWWLWPAEIDGYRLPSYQDKVGLRFVRLPPGSFAMGARPGDLDARPDEGRRQVQLTRPIWMATTEVTRAQYAQVMGLPAPTADEASLPVVNLSRDDAQTFCRRLSAVTGKSYRLPTEAEWEYACRAGGPAVVDPETFAQQAWHMNNSKGLFQPVGTKPPNRWGLHDMLGNATEWCADAYTVAGPPSGSDPVVPPEVAKSGVVRGGDKNSVAAGSRPTARTPLQPQFPYRSAGIRVVLDDPALPAASP